MSKWTWVVVALVLALGLELGREYGALDGVGEQLARANAAARDRALGVLVGESQPRKSAQWEWHMGKVKTKIASSKYSGSFDFTWHQAAGSDQGGIEGFTVPFFYGYYSGDFSMDGTAYHVYQATYDATSGFTVRVPAGEDLTPCLSFSYASDKSYLSSEVTTAPIGAKGATHAKEIVVSESWEDVPGAQTVITVTASGGAEVWGSGAWGPLTGPMTFDVNLTSIHFSLSLDPEEFSHWGKYAVAFHNIKWCGEVVDCSAYAPTNWYGSLWAEGTAAGTIGIWGGDELYNYPSWGPVTISAPLCYDFSELQFLWMDGTEIDDTVQVYCTGLRVLDENGQDPGGFAGDWHGTIAELKAQVWRQKHGILNVDSYDPDMLTTVEVYLDLTSAEAAGIEIRGPAGKFKVEGAGFGQTGTEESPIPGPVDGWYAAAAVYNENPAYTNGQFWLYCTDADAGSWAIGPSMGVPPFYEQDDAGPPGSYVVNTTDYNDDIIDTETGQRRFSAFLGEGVGPAVTEESGNTIVTDSDCRTPAFAHNATVVFDCWPVDAEDREYEPYMTDIVTLTPDADKGIYGNAHTHEDWVPDGDCTAPDEDGYFTVGDTTPYLHLTNLVTGQTVSRPLTIEFEYRALAKSSYGFGIMLGAHDVFTDAIFPFTITTHSGSGSVTIDLVDINNSLPVPDGTYAFTFALSDGTNVYFADNSGLSLTLNGGTASGWSYMQTEDEDTGAGSITLTLKCNYRDRQSKVGGTGQIAVPTAYLLRRHDSCLGQGDPPETAEAVWDWRGRYLQQQFVLPDLPTSVTCTLQYYMDMDGCSDNHQSDSTRQSEYAYSAGDLYTLERELPVSYYQTESGEKWCAVLVDLYDEQNGGQPVAMAYSLKWAFAVSGDYRLLEPKLVKDPGDRQQLQNASPGYRVAPSADGCAVKVDESWRYQQGVVSAHFNGFCYRVLFVPDNAKPCTVEKCFDTLNVLIGAKTGEDLTSNYSLAGWPGNTAGEAWTYAHDQDAEDAHMLDVDGARLSVLCVRDIAPQMDDTGITQVAVRAYHITCARGLKYAFYGTYYAGGRAHGMGLRSGVPQDYPRLRGASCGKLYRQHLDADPEAWASVENLSTDEHGHWGSAAYPVSDTDAERTLWEWKTNRAEMGRFATREFALAEALASGELTCWIGLDAMGHPAWLACVEDGDIVVYAVQVAGEWLGPSAAAMSGDYQYPSICVHEDGSLLVAATNNTTHQIEVARSRDCGATWEAVNTAFGADLQNGTLFSRKGQTFLAGWYDGKVWLVCSSATDLAREVLDGTNSTLEVCAFAVAEGDAAPLCSVVLADDGEVQVAVAGNGTTNIYGCRNYRDGFTLKA